MSDEECDVVAGVSSPFKELVGSTRRNSRLFSAQWELTYRCNERCAHCYLDIKPAAAKPAPGEQTELSTAECKRIIDELAAAGILSLTLSGGELFVRQDWFELATYARTKRILLRLFTNGTLVTPHVADQIAQIHPIMVEISVYGATAQTHEFITRRIGTFERTKQAFRLLRERHVRTKLKTCLMHQNVGEFDAMQALAAELGAQFAYTETINPSDNPLLNPAQFRLTDEDLHEFTRRYIDRSFWESRVITPETRTCNVGLNSVTIDPYGTVYPCVETRIAMGNLRTSSLREIWQDTEAWAPFRHLTVAELPDCSTCDMIQFCTRCHGTALHVDGDYRVASSENCRHAAIRRDVLAELAGEDVMRQAPGSAQVLILMDGSVQNADLAERLAVLAGPAMVTPL